jgi:hypothetical protein
MLSHALPSDLASANGSMGRCSRRRRETLALRCSGESANRYGGTPWETGVARIISKARTAPNPPTSPGMETARGGASPRNSTEDPWPPQGPRSPLQGPGSPPQGSGSPPQTARGGHDKAGHRPAPGLMAVHARRSTQRSGGHVSEEDDEAAAFRTKAGARRAGWSGCFAGAVVPVGAGFTGAGGDGAFGSSSSSGTWARSARSFWSCEITQRTRPGMRRANQNPGTRVAGEVRAVVGIRRIWTRCVS